MRTFHLASIGAIVMATGLAFGASQASADAPTPTQLMNATYSPAGYGSITLSGGMYSSATDPNAINLVAPYTMSYLTSAPGVWDGYEVSAVVTRLTQNGATKSHLWLVDSNMRTFGGTTIDGQVEAAIVSVVNGQLVLNAGIRNADGTLRQTSSVYDLVTGELKMVAPVFGPLAPGTVTTPVAVPTTGGTGTTVGQIVPASTGNAGMLPAGNLGIQMALAAAVAGAAAVARRMGRQN
jgi:hypothetical protein